jgi:hypothetical protein
MDEKYLWCQRISKGLGKIRLIEDDLVYVTLFSSEGKHPKDIDYPRSQFPAKIKVGEIFRYEIKNQTRMVTPRDLSEAELEKISKEVDAQLPPDEGERGC